MSLFGEASYSSNINYKTNPDLMSSKSLFKKLGSKIELLKPHELSHYKRIDILNAWRDDSQCDIIGIDQDNYQCLKNGIEDLVEKSVWLFTKKVVYLKPGASTWFKELAEAMETKVLELGYDEKGIKIYGFACFEGAINTHENKRQKNWRVDAVKFVKQNTDIVNCTYRDKIQKLNKTYIEGFNMLESVV